MIPLDQNQKEENPKSVKIRRTDIVFYTIISSIAVVIAVILEMFRH